MHSVPALRLHEGDRARLEALTRMSTAPAGLVRRARIVLLAAGGASNTEVAALLRVSRPTVLKWRSRYEESGIAALGDLPRPGRPATVDEVAVLVATLCEGGMPPSRLRAPFWSSRLLAGELGIAHSTVSRVWRRWGVQPHRPESFQLPAVPPLPPGAHRGVVGVCRAAPWNAVVLRADGRTGQRPEERLRPLLLDRAGADRPCTAAAFLNLLDAVAQAHPYPRLHVLLEGTGAARSRDVREWLARNPRVTLHHAPAGRSWAELTEVLLRIAGPSPRTGAAGPEPSSEPSRALVGARSTRPLTELRRGTPYEPFGALVSDGGLAGIAHRSTSSIHRHQGNTYGPDVGPRAL
ncbi:helix-turn-helix domain-containing protein [Streptomyces sp. RKAG290]|uniref:helix-turn-helix domain-containing protein n=1 Tax=Streptomyces sp. RKAG290 TaxID=2888348 RepID=UPI0020336153|nr:helix-turn-helix domain-containing protein [Streptomyces sp. RKAG290]MCM2411580.1 helix-turn-helix domain-containing protein [Streptomyces sp. RKAG290]